MAFDDATDTVTSSFSLDGGQSFQSPFPPMHVFQVIPDGEVLFGANAIESDTPASPCGGSILSARGSVDLNRAPGDQRVTLRGTLALPPRFPADFDPLTQGMRVLVEFPGGSTLDIVMPPGGPGTGCGPYDGWRVMGANYQYRNKSLLAPPACSGPAAGLATMKLRMRRLASDRTIPFALALKKASFSVINAVVHPMVLLGDDAGEPFECAETTIGCTVSGRVRHCQ
jgi:hypothetical protein